MSYIFFYKPGYLHQCYFLRHNQPEQRVWRWRRGGVPVDRTPDLVSSVPEPWESSSSHALKGSQAVLCSSLAKRDTEELVRIFLTLIRMC